MNSRSASSTSRCVWGVVAVIPRSTGRRACEDLAGYERRSAWRPESQALHRAYREREPIAVLGGSVAPGVATVGRTSTRRILGRTIGTARDAARGVDGVASPCSSITRSDGLSVRSDGQGRHAQGGGLTRRADRRNYTARDSTRRASTFSTGGEERRPLRSERYERSGRACRLSDALRRRLRGAPGSDAELDLGRVEASGATRRLLRVRARDDAEPAGMLAGINRVYVAPEKLKRSRRVARMERTTEGRCCATTPASSCRERRCGRRDDLVAWNSTSGAALPESHGAGRDALVAGGRASDAPTLAYFSRLAFVGSVPQLAGRLRDSSLARVGVGVWRPGPACLGTRTIFVSAWTRPLPSERLGPASDGGISLRRLRLGRDFGFGPARAREALGVALVISSRLAGARAAPRYGVSGLCA